MQTTAKDAVGKRILIIEDDPDILEILGIIFQEEGYEVILSETGDETAIIHLIIPDIVLLDVRLERSAKNGDVLCAELKSQPATHQLPVLLLSAERDIKQICVECGANGYIAKPFDITALVLKVRQFTSQ